MKICRFKIPAKKVMFLSNFHAKKIIEKDYILDDINIISCQDSKVFK